MLRGGAEPPSCAAARSPFWATHWGGGVLGGGPEGELGRGRQEKSFSEGSGKEASCAKKRLWEEVGRKGVGGAGGGAWKFLASVGVATWGRRREAGGDAGARRGLAPCLDTAAHSMAAPRQAEGEGRETATGRPACRLPPPAAHSLRPNASTHTSRWAARPPGAPPNF